MSKDAFIKAIENGTISRLETLGELVQLEVPMLRIARRLDISRAALYKFIDAYDLTGYIESCRNPALSPKERRKLIAEVIRKKQNGHGKPQSPEVKNEYTQ